MRAMSNVVPKFSVSNSTFNVGMYATSLCSPSTIFNGLIILSTAIPLATYVMHTFFTNNFIWMYFYFMVPLIGTLSGTHVFATTSLFFDSEIGVGIAHKWLKLFIIPSGIVAINIAAATVMPLGLLLWFMVFYVHYALFHFGRQNIGVLTFSFLSVGRKPISALEKRILNAVTCCGMLGALKVFWPGLMLNPDIYPFDLSKIEPVVPILFNVGMVLYVGIIIFAVAHFVQHRQRFVGSPNLIYWICVFWYSTIYLFPDYPLMNLALFSTSHGLQYLVFLGFHSYFRSRDKARLRRNLEVGPALSSKVVNLVLSLIPIAILIVSMLVGRWLWAHQNDMFENFGTLIQTIVAHDGVLKVGIGMILGLTMAHYWVDQHIWKFKNPERRKWLLQRYPFLALSHTA